MIHDNRLSMIPALVVALGLATAPSAAHSQSAETFIQKFEEVCVSSHGDRAAALEAMDAAGWMVAPQHVIDQLGAGLSNVEARLYSARNVVYVAMVADAPLDESTPVCWMAMAPGVADLTGPLTAWSGGAPLMQDEDGDVSFLFSESGGVRRLLTDRSEAQRLSRTDAILMVSARTTPQLSNIISMRRRDIVW